MPRSLRDRVICRAFAAGRLLAPRRRVAQEIAMELVADRFVVHDDDHVVDLATGYRVVLVTAPLAADADQMAWNASCDFFQQLRHRAIVPLLDYGPLARRGRFEAWQCGSSWTGAEAAAVCARRLVGDFLQHAGLVVNEAGFRVQTRHGAPAIIPPVAVQTPARHDDATGQLPLADRALVGVHRVEVPALAGMFSELSGPRLQAAALFGPRGSGKSSVVNELARLARSHGFVPIAARFVDAAYRDLWRGRSVFVIDDEEGLGWRATLQVEMESPWPHALLLIGRAEIQGLDGVALSRVDAQALLAAILPRAMSPEIEAQARSAADQSGGWPGRFAEAAGMTVRTLRSPRRATRSARVAEQPAAYGGDERLDPVRVPTEPAVWPAPGELAALRRRIVSARADLDRGRHMRGVRRLRQAIGGLSRRDAWPEAADGALALARALLQRGAIRDAQKALVDAREAASRNGSESRLLDIAILSGEAWIDAARLDEAEAVLAAAVTTSTVIGSPAQLALATVGLARCLFWRGRYEDAKSAIARDSAEVPDAIRLRRERWKARILCGCGDGASALQAIAALTDSLSETASPSARASLRTTDAWVRLAIGDVEGAAKAAEMAVRDAHLARVPLSAIRARLVMAETHRRRGRATEALARLQRLERLGGSTLPPLVAARLGLLQVLATGGDGADVTAFIARSGIPALALLAPTRVAPGVGLLVEEVVAIVQACQTADEELAVLRDVCERIRQQLHAAAVSFIATGSTSRDALVGAGGRIDRHIADRALDTGILIQPHHCDNRLEAAAPILYGGAAIAALCVKWTLGSTHDRSRAAAVMVTAAAAAAPLVSAAIARRARVAAAAPAILGVTPPMVELRRQVERAAAAPFAVLIQGESGSGKELVAQAIHRGSARRDRAFRTLNCAAIPDELADAELFGHARGSFTGAVADRVGVFEEAHGGTLFLDEVGELTPRPQAKLLRVLQEGEIRRVGENLSRRIDVRIVAATNRDLAAETEAGRFRQDLLYRLDVVRIALPPLRQRPDDIPLLVDHYWRDATTRIGSRAALSAATVGALARYEWPGNVRELQNVLAALAVRCPKRGVVLPSALPPQFGVNRASDAWRLDDARRAFEERFIRAALVRSGGHRARAAEELGLTRQGLTKLLTRLGISPPARGPHTG